MATRTQAPVTTTVAPLNRPIARVVPASKTQKPLIKYTGDVEVKYLSGVPFKSEKVAGSTVSIGNKSVSEVKIKEPTIQTVPKEGSEQASKDKKVQLVGEYTVEPTIVAKRGTTTNSVTVPTQRLDASIKALTNPDKKKSTVLKAADGALVSQATVKDIDEYNLSFAYGVYKDEKDPVNTPFDRTYRPLLKGKNEPVLVQQPRFMPLGQSHVGGVYGTDRFRYNDEVKKVPLLNTTN